MRVIIILTIITANVKWVAEVVKWVLVRGLPPVVLDFHERAAKSDLLALSALLLQTSIVKVSTVLICPQKTQFCYCHALQTVLHCSTLKCYNRNLCTADSRL